MSFFTRILGKGASDNAAELSSPPETPTHPERDVALGGYVFRLPEGFVEPEIRTSEDFSILKSAATGDVTFDVLVVPTGGDEAIDGYFGSALRRYEVGRPRGFKLEHMGQHFRGWLVEQSPSLSEVPGALSSTMAPSSTGTQFASAGQPSRHFPRTTTSSCCS